MLRRLAVAGSARMFRGYSALAAREFTRSAEHAPSAQMAVLRRLARATARTDYGKSHGLPADADYRAWRERLPVVDWLDLEPSIAREREHAGALVADPVVQWTRSRCTSCTYKWIPYTSALKRSFTRALSLWGHDLLADGLRLRTGYCYLEIEPPHVRSLRAGEVADDGDYIARPLAALMRQIVVVDPRVRRLSEADSFQQVLALSLVAAAELELISLFHPSWFVDVCDYIVAHRAELAALLDEGQVTAEGQVFRFARLSPRRRDALLAGDLAALWPALRLVSTPAEHVDAASAADLARRLPQAHHQGKGLLTTEAPLTIPLRPAGGAVPLVHELFYELQSDDGAIDLLADAREGVDYTLVISQAAGLVRYRTGERVRMTHRWHALPCLQHIAYA